MAISRIVRVNELLKREIAEDLHRVFSMTDFDTAAITVTRVAVTPDLRDANVYISIFGHEDEREEMIKFLNRRKQDIVKKMIKRVKLKYTPRLLFVHDTTLEEGDNILKLLNELDLESTQTSPSETENEQK